jgi:hypothetical protein
MRRFILAGATLITLSTPVALAVGASPASASASASASSISCASLKGTISGDITIAKCTPKTKGYAKASAATSSLASGAGTIKWSPNGKTTVITTTFSSKGQGPCKKGTSEYVAKGSVTGGTATNTKVGDAVSVSVCVNTSSGAVTLAPKTTVLL